MSEEEYKSNPLYKVYWTIVNEVEDEEKKEEKIKKIKIPKEALEDEN